ncbi:hypothetical protein [Polaribacter sp. SA4-12]|nr:hypothetical protein [Polaribacter sp. SA4-12]
MIPFFLYLLQHFDLGLIQFTEQVLLQTDSFEIEITGALLV